MVVDDVQNRSLHQLRLHDGCHHLDHRLSWEHHGTLRNRVDISGKSEVSQILQKVLLENTQRSQILDILRLKAKLLDILDHLLQSRRDGISAATGIVSVKGIENNGGILSLVFEISLHHCQFI